MSLQVDVVARERSVLLYVSALTVTTLGIFGPTIGWFNRFVGLTGTTITELQQYDYLHNVLQPTEEPEHLPSRSELPAHVCGSGRAVASTFLVWQVLKLLSREEERFLRHKGRYVPPGTEVDGARSNRCTPGAARVASMHRAARNRCRWTARCCAS